MSFFLSLFWDGGTAATPPPVTPPPAATPDWTARDVIKRALRRLEVIAAGEEPSAEEARDALRELNALLVSFAREGIKRSAQRLVMSDTLDMDDGLAMFVSNMLTERLAGEYGRQLTPTQAREANEAKRMLQAAYWLIEGATLDPAVWRPTSTRFRSDS